MSRRNNILVLLLVFALLLCEVNVAGAGASYRAISGALSAANEVQDTSLSVKAGTVSSELGTPELIRGHSSGTLLGIRAQSKGRELQRSGLRALLLFVLVLCLFKVAFRYLRCGISLPDDAISSSVILFFIHDQDGKK